MTIPAPRRLARRCALIALCVSLLALPRSQAQTAATGSLTGKVLNTSNGQYLASVKVTVVGTKLTATTDENGTYTLRGVPQGDVRLHVDYIGFSADDQQVNVGAGISTVSDFDLVPVRTVDKAGERVVQLQKFTVVADEEQSARSIALNDQRNSPSLKSVVATDEYPIQGTGNIGEMLQYVPGLALVYSANAPLDVSVRGLPGYTTDIEVDGASVPTAYPGGTRSSALFGIPFSNASRIEVTKMPTPDVPAASMGGTINIISRSGFLQKTPSFDYSLYSTFRSDASLRKQPGAISEVHVPRLGPSFNVNYVQPFSKTFSVTIGGGYIFNFPILITTTPVYNLLNGIETTPQYSTGQQIQKTANYNFGADWKPNDQNLIKFTFQGRKRDAASDNAAFEVIFGGAATGDQHDVNGVTTGSGGVAQTTNASRLVMVTNSGTISHTYTGQDWKLESSFSYSEADTRTGPTNGAFNSASLRLAGNEVVNGSGIAANPWGTGMEMLPSVLTATDTKGNPVNIFDQSQLVVASGTNSDIYYRRNNAQFKSMVTRDLGTAIPVSLKAGVQYNNLDYLSNGQTLTYTMSPTATAGALGLVDPSYTMPFAGHNLEVVDLQKMWAYYLAHPSQFSVTPASAWQSTVNNYKHMAEEISAGFLRTDVKLFDNRLWLVGGVRYEKTEDKGVGGFIDPTGSLEKDANGNLILTSTGATIPITTDATQVAYLQYKLGGAHADRNYSGYYPSFNASFALTDQLLLRAGYARTIGRPDLTNILPGVTYSASTANPQTITVNNIGLNPWTANNYDLSLESYLLKGGFGSVSVFQKDITGFFQSVAIPVVSPEQLATYGITGAQDLEYEILTKSNSPMPTRIQGFEANYRQKLDPFVPYWARGVELSVNYTGMSVHGSDTADFSGFNPQTLMYGVSLTRPWYSIEFLMQQQGEVRRAAVAASTTSGIPNNTYLWQEPKKRPTISATINLTRHISLFGTVSDFFHGGFQDRQFEYSTTTPSPEYAKIQRLIEAGTTVTAGVKGKF